MLIISTGHPELVPPRPKSKDVSMEDIRKFDKWLNEEHIEDWEHYFEKNRGPVIWPESENLWNYEKV